MYIIGYTHTKELGKKRIPETFMNLYMTEDRIYKIRTIIPETYIIIFITEDLIEKK